MKFPLRPTDLVISDFDNDLGDLLVQPMLSRFLCCFARGLLGCFGSQLVPFFLFWRIVCCRMSIIKFFSQLVVTMILISISLLRYTCFKLTFEPYVSNQPPLVEAQSDFQV